ncbi:hypothetical protein TNCV_4021661 [Trichonephila clavipes]|nr:hypothetical protein TNCV_4021661 [Trichonephila clavipes]
MPHCKGLLETDLKILNLGQPMRTTRMLQSPFPNYHTNGRTLSLGRFKVNRSLTRRVFGGTRLELMTYHPRSDTLTTRLPWPSTSLSKSAYEENINL